MTSDAGGPCLFLLSVWVLVNRGVSESGNDIRICWDWAFSLCTSWLVLGMGPGERAAQWQHNSLKPGPSVLLSKTFY